MIADGFVEGSNGSAEAWWISYQKDRMNIHQASAEPPVPSVKLSETIIWNLSIGSLNELHGRIISRRHRVPNLMVSDGFVEGNNGSAEAWWISYHTRSGENPPGFRRTKDYKIIKIPNSFTESTAVLRKPGGF